MSEHNERKYKSYSIPAEIDEQLIAIAEHLNVNARQPGDPRFTKTGVLLKLLQIDSTLGQMLQEVNDGLDESDGHGDEAGVGVVADQPQATQSRGEKVNSSAVWKGVRPMQPSSRVD